MKKSVRIKVILGVLGCLLFGNMSVLAAEKDFVEIPQNQINLLQEDETIEPKASPSLSGCNLGIGIASNGLQLTYRTRATQTADEIGVKDIVLQEKVWYGWKDIPVGNYCTYNSDMYAGGVVYTAAEKGKTYRVHCTHYAKFGGTELTLYGESSEFVYN